MVRGRTTAPAGLVLGPRDHRRSRRGRPRRGVHQGRRPVLGAVQHLLRPLPQLQRRPHRRLPQRQPRPARHQPTATSTWAAGSAARPNTSWCPYADWNLLKFPDKDQAMEKILDLAMLSDIFPTGYHGCVHRRSHHRLHRLHRRRRTRRPGRRHLGANCSAPPSSSSATSTRTGSPKPPASAAKPSTSPRRPQGPDRTDPRRPRSRLRRRRRRLRSPRPRRRRARTERPATVLNS